MDSTPCWASSAPSSLTKGCKRTVGDFVSWPPSNPAAFAHVAAFLAARYRNQLEAFEVWNEPDHSNQLYFAGPDKPERYAAILRAAYPEIKAAAPNVPVLAGALVGWNGELLKALYAAGIKGYYDGLSVHYYDLVLADLRAIHQVQLQNSDTKPLWLAEFGWSSCAPARSQAGQLCVKPATEAQNRVDIVRATQHADIKEMYVYSIADTCTASASSTETCARSRFYALRTQLGARVSPKPRATKIEVRGSHGRAVIVASGPAGDLYSLNVSKNGVMRYVSTVRLNLNNQFTVKLPQSSAHASSRSSSTSWQGRKYAVTRHL
jgi:hypothetical protein